MGGLSKRVVASLVTGLVLTVLAAGGLSNVSWQGGADAEERRLQFHMNPQGVDSSSSNGGIASVYGGSTQQSSQSQAGVPYNPYGAETAVKTNSPYALYGKIAQAVGSVTAFLLFIMYACMYKTWVVDELPEFGGYSGADFPKVFDCFRIPDWGNFCGTCLWAWCCFPVVNAKNYAATDTCGYWPSICLIWGGYSCGWCPGACIKTMLSMRLKENLNLDTNCFQEFATACCCVWCETAREAMMVDEELGVKISCPFQVEVDSGASTAWKDVKELVGLEDRKVDMLQHEDGDNGHKRRNCTVGNCAVM